MREDFENPHPALVAVAPAFLAADRAEDGRIGHARGVERKRAHFLVGELGGSLADRAEFPHQALGEDGADGGGDEEGLHADVGETGDGGGRVVGVQGGENQVTGE